MMRDNFVKKRSAVWMLSLSLLLTACATHSSYPQQSMHKAGMLSSAEIAAQYQVNANWLEIYHD